MTLVEHSQEVFWLLGVLIAMFGITWYWLWLINKSLEGRDEQEAEEGS